MYTLYIQEIDGVWFAVAFKDNTRIVTSTFSRHGRKKVTTAILNNLSFFSSFSEAEPNDAVLNVIRSMYNIYQGKSGECEFQVDMDRLPPFTHKVLLVTSKIPRGSVTTYGGIARALGKKWAARAVGQVEARNPFPLIIPCHRVVGSDLMLHGYKNGLDVKRAILKREGVTFVGNRVSVKNLWSPEIFDED